MPEHGRKRVLALDCKMLTLMKLARVRDGLTLVPFKEQR
jgi:hypothetical protein